MSQPYAEVFLERARPRVRQPSASEVRVIQAEYSHEIAVLTYVYSESMRSAVRKGKPVMVRWGWPPLTAEFVGHVHHVTVDEKPDRQRHTRYLQVVCVGATDVLNPPEFSQYRNVRVDAVVSEMARGNRFSALIERHPYAWPLLQQEGQSTWAFLVECAQRVGWTLYPRGTDIRCHSRAIRFGGAVAYRSFPPGYTPDRGAIHDFEIVQSETLNTGAKKRRRVVRGVDALGTLFTVSTGLPGNLSGPRARDAGMVEYRSTSASSIAEAQAVLTGEQEANRHHICAKTTVSGDARVHVASAVRLVGVDQDHDGFWYTTRAEHILTATTYQIALELGRDSLGDPNGARLVRVIPGDTSMRAVVHRGAAISSANQDQTAPPPRYVGERWQSLAATERLLPPQSRPASVRAAPSPTGVFEVPYRA